ncbi:MAG: response regulator [Nitrospira sp.]|nr:response regulator [Nitrospira sp.]
MERPTSSAWEPKLGTHRAELTQTGPLRTLLVDDSLEMLRRLEQWLGGHPIFEIVGKAYSGPDAVSQSRALHPDLVVMDVKMPLMNGPEAAIKMKTDVHGPTVILTSFFDLPEAYTDPAWEADAFLRKDALHEELLPTVARLFPALQGFTEA